MQREKWQCCILMASLTEPGTLLNKLTSDWGKRRVIDSLKRRMQVDDGTVQYYLSISDGDPRAAFSQFSSDLRWETQRLGLVGNVYQTDG